MEIKKHLSFSVYEQFYCSVYHKKDENKYIFFLEWAYELTAPKQCSFETGGVTLS